MPRDAMPIVGALLLFLAACATAYVVPHVVCDVPLFERCGTDTECECMYGEEP